MYMNDTADFWEFDPVRKTEPLAPSAVVEILKSQLTTRDDTI